MGYVAPRRDHIEEDVVAQRRERAIASAVLAVLLFAACLLMLALAARDCALT